MEFTQEHKHKISLALKGKPKSLEHRRKLSESRLSKSGGRLIDKYGYVMIYSPNHPNHDAKGYVKEHRLIMEQYLGRYLTKDEEIHHKNKNKQDNRIENLQLLSSRSSHIIIHVDENRKLNILTRKCSNCGNTKTGLKNTHSKYRPHYSWYTNPITKNGYWCNRCYTRYNMRKWRAAKKTT